jgi:hypothetical protein
VTIMDTWSFKSLCTSVQNSTRSESMGLEFQDSFWLKIHVWE